MTDAPGSDGAEPRPRSADGRFEWRADLRVWAPLGEVPPGTETPDGLFEWTGTEWRPLRPLPTQVAARRSVAEWIGVVAAVVVCVLGATAVAFAIFLYIAVQSLPSRKG